MINHQFLDSDIESVDIAGNKIVVQAWGHYIDFSREDITVMYEAMGINKDQAIKDSLEQHNEKVRGNYGH